MTSPTSIYSPFLNPLNAILLLPLTYLLYLLLFPPLPTSKPLARKYDPEVYNWLPATHSPVLLYKKYTAKELSVYDGKGGGRICLAILRVGRDLKIEKAGERTVFDVTSGRGFYGPNGMYGNFAGRDASRGMAKQSFDEDMLTAIDKPLDSLTDLTPAEVDNMKGWHEHFDRKYIVCGELVEPGEGD